MTVPDGDLILGSTAVTSTAAELNLLDGVSGLVQADLTKLAAIDSSATEINQLDGISRGSILYGNASGATARLAKGSAGTVLSSDGTDISWAAAGGGGGAMEFIASSGAISNAASVSFTQFDASEYDHYEFWFQHVIPVTNSVFLRGHASTNGGSNYDDTNGNYHQGSTDKTGFSIHEATAAGSGTNHFGVSGIFRLLAPHLSTYTYGSSDTTVTYTNNDIYKGSDGMAGSSAHLSAGDVDAIQFKFTSGNIETGEIVMYGIKNA